MPYGKIYGGFHNEEKILAIFLVVAMVAALAVGLTACKKDDGKKDAKEITLPAYNVEEPDYSGIDFRTSKSVCFACMTKTARTTKTSS